MPAAKPVRAERVEVRQMRIMHGGILGAAEGDFDEGADDNNEEGDDFDETTGDDDEW